MEQKTNKTLKSYVRRTLRRQRKAKCWLSKNLHGESIPNLIKSRKDWYSYYSCGIFLMSSNRIFFNNWETFLNK